MYRTCYIKINLPCTSMSISISPHTKGTILSSPAQLTVNTLKVKVPCITRDEELLKSCCLYYNQKKPKQTKTTTRLLSLWNLHYFIDIFSICVKKIKITNSNKQDWWGERTNVTFAINVNVFHMVVYCT